MSLPKAYSMNDESVSESSITCPHCGSAVRYGELKCPNCGTILAGLAPENKTRKFDGIEETPAPGSRVIGSIPRRYQKVTLIIDGKQSPLPAAQRLIIGRLDPKAGAPPPDIDLMPFGAETLGVSRQHIELIWKNDLIFIADLGSTNGTLLNGQRLGAGMERILRDNDELVIGHLAVRVRFVDG